MPRSATHPRMKHRWPLWLLIGVSLLAAPMHVSALAVAPAPAEAALATPVPTAMAAADSQNAVGPDRGRHAPTAPEGSGRNPGSPQALPRLPVAKLNHMDTPRVVLADYMLWYSPETFNNGLTFDLPEAGPYSSTDPAT